jgi:hypothetical protein
MIPLRIKLLTPTAKAPEAANEGDLLDLFADSFSVENLESPISKTKVFYQKKTLIVNFWRVLEFL